MSNRNAPIHCRKCNKVIQEGEPLWRDSYMLPYWWRHYRGSRIECLTCAEVGKEGGKVSLGDFRKITAVCCRCDGCGREVWRKYRRSRKYTLHSFCTEKCEQRYYIDRLKSRRALERERSCIQCGVTFTPQRSDARTCSNKCRQAQYRKLANAANVSRIDEAIKAAETADFNERRVREARFVLHHAYEQAQVRKGRAETYEARFEALKAAAPDLAEMVVEEKLGLEEAEAAERERTKQVRSRMLTDRI